MFFGVYSTEVFVIVERSIAVMFYRAFSCIILLRNHMTMHSNTMVTGVHACSFVLQSMEPVYTTA